jgi:hypothetical protein
MVWGTASIPVTSMSVEGLSALAVVLVFISGVVLTRSRRAARP